MENLNKYIFPLAIAAGIFLFGRKILQGIGLVETKEEKELEKNLANKWLTPKPFNDFVKKTNFKIPAVFRMAVIPNFVAEVYESKGFFSDDEEKLFSLFRRLQSKMQVSALAHFFQKEYGRDMASYLDSFLNESEIARLIDIVNQKPKEINGFYQARSI